MGSTAASCGQGAALLWLPAGSHALRRGWLTEAACLHALEPAAWVIGSAQLMDCERKGGWIPPPACCTSEAQLSRHHLGPVAIYAALDDDFYDYVMEYYSGKLFAPPAGAWIGGPHSCRIGGELRLAIITSTVEPVFTTDLLFSRVLLL